MFSLNKCRFSILAPLLLAAYLDTAIAQNNSFQAVPSQLVFNLPQAGSLAQQPSQSFNISTTAPGTTVQFATSAPVWLTLTPLSGSVSNTAQSITANLNTAAASFQNGSYLGAIVISQSGLAGGTVTALSIPVILNVGNQLTISPSTTINLNYQSGQTPPSVSLNVNSTGVALPFFITNIQPAASWLQPSVVPNATTPGTVNVTINPNNLAGGNYAGSFTLSSTSALVSAVTVTVNLTVSLSATLTAAPQSLSFAYQTGTVSGALPSKTILLTTNGAPVAFTVDPSTQSWLTVTPNGTVASQTQPATLTVTANPNSPTALLPNTYSTNITVRTVGAAANSQPLTIPVSLLVSVSPLLILGNPPTTFNYQIGGAAPGDQSVSISSSSAQTPVDYTVSDKPAWLDVAPGSATTALSGTLTLHVNQAALSTLGVGTYTGNVTLRSNGAGNSPVTFPVALNVSFTPSISTNIAGLTFNYQTTMAQPGGQFFTVNSTGAPLPVGIPAFSSTTCGGNWITVVTANGLTPATIFVTANTGGISAPSTCTGTISVPSGTSTPLTVPVTLNVSATPLLNVTAPDLTFTTPLGSNTIQQKTITLSGTDPNTPLNYSINSDQAWLSVNPNAGRTDTAASVNLFINPAVFTQPGTYTGNLTVTNQSANPAGSQPAQKILVTVTVTSNVTLSTSPQTVNITAPIGGQPVSTPLALSLSSGTAGFTATASSAQGWLKLSVSGSTPAAQVGGSAPATINVVADPTSVGLAQGTYTGMITIISPGLQNSPLNVTVNLTVASAQTIALSVPSISFNTNVGATSNLTQTFNVTSTGGPLNFTLTKGSTGCDAISFSPSNGATGTAPVPVTVTLNPTGLPSGAIACTLTVAGPQGSGIVSQTFIVNVNVGAVVVPQVTAVVNAASFAPGPVAPGEIVTIYGVNIGPTTLTTYILNSNNTFATIVADTQVLFDTFAAPIIYVRNDQLSVVVPFEIAGRSSVSITVRRGGQTSPALQMQVVGYVPAIFTTNQQGFGQGAIVNSNGLVNGPGTPSGQGQVIAIYMTGAGLMSQNNQTGGVAGVNPLPTLPANTPVTVSIGGQPATVQYAGGAPGNINGLYQINATVPANIGTGTQPIVVTIGGVPVQGNVTLSVQ